MMSEHNNNEHPDQTLEIQASVFNDEVEKEQHEHGAVNIVAFIVENAPLFRYFAEHLPDTLRESWEKALEDKQSMKAIETEYETFRRNVEEVLSNMDPETMTELVDAAERGDVDEASRIIETYLHTRERTAE